MGMTKSVQAFCPRCDGGGAGHTRRGRAGLGDVRHEADDPGVSLRTIWDSNQVACYKLPNGVNHNGYIHMELKFKPNWADFDVYLLNEYGQTLSEEMGYMASLTGKEVIDHYVSQGDFDNAPGSTDVIPEDPLHGRARAPAGHRLLRRHRRLQRDRAVQGVGLRPVHRHLRGRDGGV